MLDPLLIVELGVLGLATGFLAGLLGIGGGMLLVPFMTYILGAQKVAPDLAVKMAIATSMATIMFTSISSVRAHHQRGAVRWDIVKRLAPGIVLGGFVASLGVFALLKGSFLAIFFALFVSFSATQMFLDKKPAPTRQMPGGGGQVAAGGVIGFLSGLVGAGGGFVSVPFMTWCNVPIHNAVATSAALGFPIALANVIGYAISGQTVSGLPQRIAGIHLVACPGRDCHLQRTDGSSGRQSCTQSARKTTQARFRIPVVWLGCVHALERPISGLRPAEASSSRLQGWLAGSGFTLCAPLKYVRF